MDLLRSQKKFHVKSNCTQNFIDARLEPVLISGSHVQVMSLCLSYVKWQSLKTCFSCVIGMSESCSWLARTRHYHNVCGEVCWLPLFVVVLMGGYGKSNPNHFHLAWAIISVATSWLLSGPTEEIISRTSLPWVVTIR